jgi:hypothetical protein
MMMYSDYGFDIAVGAQGANITPEYGEIQVFHELQTRKLNDSTGKTGKILIFKKRL